MQLSQLPSIALHPRRYRPGGIGNWSGHLPFAYDLVFSLKPALLVELGTHYGESYFGFCQAVEESKTACLCYAVDTWHGDMHSGQYGEDVFSNVQSYNSSAYSSFSTLLRMTFAEAASYFSESSIDLLHIDGLHTYEAIKQDFQQWLPKVSDGGLILFHDIAVRRNDFAVWRFWEELARQFPTFTFSHGNGLGVLQKRTPISAASAEPPKDTQPPSALVSTLLDMGHGEEKEWLRTYYAACAERLELRFNAANAPTEPTAIPLQVFYPQASHYGDERSLTTRVLPGAWKRVCLTLPVGAGQGRLRIDPADRPCLATIANLDLFSATNRRVVWSAHTPSELQQVTAGGSAIRLPAETGCEILSFGVDPQLYLPDLAEFINGQPLELEIDIKVDVDPSVWLPRIASLLDPSAVAARDEAKIEHN